MSKSYQTVQGDTWDMIAKQVYGSELLADILMSNNPRLLDTVVFSAGIEVYAPVVEKSEKLTDLPPWRW